jgi:hypothetical protein
MCRCHVILYWKGLVQILRVESATMMASTLVQHHRSMLQVCSRAGMHRVDQALREHPLRP